MPFGSNVVGFSILDFLPFLFFVSPILYLVVGSSRIPVLDGHCTFVLTHFIEILCLSEVAILRQSGQSSTFRWIYDIRFCIITDLQFFTSKLGGPPIAKMNEKTLECAENRHIYHMWMRFDFMSCRFHFL